MNVCGSVVKKNAICEENKQRSIIVIFSSDNKLTKVKYYSCPY